jgi:carboxylesterase
MSLSDSREDVTVPVLPGAESFRHDGGPLGVLLCHGFTGSPASMRPWADFLAERGVTVSLPRLPGHGTTWMDLQKSRWLDWYGEDQRALLDLTDHCSEIFVMGLSMGGTLALRLAEQHPEIVKGLVLVNPSLRSDNKGMKVLPLLKAFVPSVKGVSNDIAMPGQDEVAYDRTPLKALYSLSKLWRITTADLGTIKAPLLVYRSTQDHVVEDSSGRLLLERVGSSDVEQRVLDRSYHVATLDYDAETIFQGSWEFLQRHSQLAAG